MSKFNIKTVFKWFLPFLVALILLSATIVKDTDFKIVKSLEIFYAVFRQVINHYADETDPEDLLKEGIDGMLSSLDPYTRYFDEKDTKQMKQMHTGRYVGIGATISRIDSSTIIIADILENCPAQKNGVKHGDILYAIDSIRIIKQSINEIGDLLRGSPNSQVHLTLKRQDKLISLTFKRENITIPNVPYFGILSDSIGYIRLNGFSTDATKEIKNAIKEMKNINPKLVALILDLRGNPGGLLNEAIDITNLFVEKGKTIVTLKKRNTISEQEYKTKSHPLDKDIRLAILVDNHSASASEVVSGAIQDLDRGIIAGQRTFGKGLVQSEIPLPYNSALNLTTSKYYIPSGRCIQAIDYFNKKDHDGKAYVLPDSLRKAYKTVNGRTVLDGGGIIPDTTLKEDSVNDFIQQLIAENIIFDFANQYAFNHPDKEKIRFIDFSKDVFPEFLLYLEKSSFRYQTKSLLLIDSLSNELKKLPQNSNSIATLETLRNQILPSTKQLALENKSIIETYLKMNIFSRYYYIHGQYEAYLPSDNAVNSVINILQDKTKYHAFLK